MRRIALGSLIVFVLCVSHAAAGDVVGWRTDWTGKYPDADPPTKWSATETVVWKTPMPSWSNSTTILVGDRLFVCSEPTTLVCLRLSDGKILWQKDHPLTDAFPPQEMAKARADMKRIGVEAVQEQIKALKKEMGQVQRRLRKDPKNAQLKTNVEQFKKRIGQEEKRLDPIRKYLVPPTQPVNGYSSPTPVSDGKRVYVLFGTGVAACYDLEGNRQWMVGLERSTNAWGHSASPVLSGDKLLVLINSLFALNTSDGTVAWKQRSGQRWGTSVVTRIGDQEVVITPNGNFFRVSDGKKIGGRTVGLQFNQPVIDDGVVYFIQHKGKAYKLPSQASESLELSPLWTTKPRKDRYYASPVVHDGLVYAITQKNIFSAIDAKTGEVVYEENLKLGRGQAYPSIALAGKYLYVSGKSGTTALIQPGREFKEVGRNSLEEFRSSPVFAGQRMYVRTTKHVYCIGK